MCVCVCVCVQVREIRESRVTATRGAGLRNRGVSGCKGGEAGCKAAAG